MSTYAADSQVSYLPEEFAPEPHRRHHGGHHGGRNGGSRHQFGFVARLAAEALGTFMLVLAIILSLAFTVLSAQSWLVIALTVGMMLAGAMAAVGHVSGGGDFNPAVSLAKAIAGRLSWNHFGAHFVGQIVGAMLAALVAWAILPHTFAEVAQYGTREALLGTTAPGYGSLSPLAMASDGRINVGAGAALLVEVIFTALFVAVVLGATRRRAMRSGTAPLIVGMTFAALWLMTWPITRGGLNPVRAFASAMLSFDHEVWAHIWPFVVGPLLGGALAGVFYKAFHPGHPITATAGLAGHYGEDRYTVTDVADPVLVQTAAPVIEQNEANYVPASTDAYENEVIVEEPVEKFVVTDDEVIEDGDPIVFGKDAETVRDILEADGSD